MPTCSRGRSETSLSFRFRARRPGQNWPNWPNWISLAARPNQWNTCRDACENGTRYVEGTCLSAGPYDKPEITFTHEFTTTVDGGRLVGQVQVEVQVQFRVQERVLEETICEYNCEPEPQREEEREEERKGGKGKKELRDQMRR